MYINDKKNIIRATHKELVTGNPNKSLPANGTNIIMDIWFYIHPTAKPVYDAYSEVVEPLPPAKVGNEYHEQWVVYPMGKREIKEILDREKDQKYEEIWDQSDIVKADAQSAFVNSSIQGSSRSASVRGNPQSVSAQALSDNSSDRSMRRVNDILGKRHSKVINKQIKGQPLDPREKKFNNDYDKLLDYEDAVDDAADSAQEVVEAMDNATDVVGYDVINGPKWPIYR